MGWSCVSIHARPRMAARHRAADVDAARVQFQSTRDHEWPRDGNRMSGISSDTCFNPRATTNGRATAGRCRCQRHPCFRFQSTRDHEWPRDRGDRSCRRSCVLFHSMRHHEWPRDQIDKSVTCKGDSFNPRATTNGRATEWILARAPRPESRFQSTARRRMAARPSHVRTSSPFVASFNPRATTNGRATSRKQGITCLQFCFNPRATTNGRATSRSSSPDAPGQSFQPTRDHEWPRDYDEGASHSWPRFQSTRDHEWPRDGSLQIVTFA